MFLTVLLLVASTTSAVALTSALPNFSIAVVLGVDPAACGQCVVCLLEQKSISGEDNMVRTYLHYSFSETEDTIVIAVLLSF